MASDMFDVPSNAEPLTAPVNMLYRFNLRFSCHARNMLCFGCVLVVFYGVFGQCLGFFGGFFGFFNCKGYSSSGSL